MKDDQIVTRLAPGVSGHDDSKTKGWGPMAVKKRQHGLTEEEKKEKKAAYNREYQKRRKGTGVARKSRARRAAAAPDPAATSGGGAHQGISLRLGPHSIGLSLEPDGDLSVRIGKVK